MSDYGLETEFHAARMNAERSRDYLYEEQIRPFFLLRPRVFKDGDKWCALLSDDLQIGVAAFGDTPAKAASAFDVAWRTGEPT